MTDNAKFGFIGVGRKLPENVLTNQHLEKIVNTSDEWILQRTGIQKRHISGKNEDIVHLAVEAAKSAIDNSRIDIKQIKYIRVGVNTYLRFPSLAAVVQKELGLKNASAADISAGCSAFIFGTEDIYNRLWVDKLRRNEDNYGLVIGVDVLSHITDYTDRTTCVLFGDGAGAAVLGPVETGEILSIFTRTQAEYSDLLYLEGFLSESVVDPESMLMKSRNGTNYPFLRMEGRKVFVVAVRTMMSDIRSVIAKYNKTNNANLTIKDIDFVIPHQANLRIVSAVQEGLKLKPEQVYRDGVINYGNTSAASIPIGYVDEWGKRPGAIEVDVAFGAGFASGAILRRVKEKDRVHQKT